jgi:hypothetical protein
MRNSQIDSPIEDRERRNLAPIMAALLTTSISAAADAPLPAATLTALQCGHLIDTVNGKTLGETTIVTEGGKIKDVLSGLKSPEGAKILDLSTQTCMPGLIDAHTHLTGANVIRRWTFWSTISVSSKSGHLSRFPIPTGGVFSTSTC